MNDLITHIVTQFLHHNVYSVQFFYPAIFASGLAIVLWAGRDNITTSLTRITRTSPLLVRIIRVILWAILVLSLISMVIVGVSGFILALFPPYYTHVVVLAAFAFCFFKLVEVCDTALSKLGEKQKDHTPTSPTTNKNSTKYPSKICTPKPAHHLVLTVSTR